VSITQILDEIYPLTMAAKYSAKEFAIWKHKREKLKRMIEQYKAGELINFKPLNISVNLEELLKRIRN
jgi:hypothetical protein